MNEPLPEQLSILVVEDDAGDYGLLRATLRQAGLVAFAQIDAGFWAQTLAEAVTAVKHMAALHVVLLDLSLPDSAGLATVLSMRAAAPELAIIVLTGHDDLTLAADALEAGAQDYLVKGQIDSDALRRAVRNAMVRHKLERKVALNEARFHDFSSAASDWWLWEMDAQLRFSWFSVNAQQAIGRSPQTMLGKRRQEIGAHVTGDEKEIWASHLDDLAQHRPFKQFEYRIELPDGDYQWLSISGVPIIDDAGGFGGYRGTGSNASDRKAMEEQVRQLAFYDVLTGLPNRRLLLDRLGQAMASGKRSGLYAALMFLDLDKFKPLNDVHGHGVGDLLLIEVAKRLLSCVREVDTVARFGGDEFVVILGELTLDKAQSTEQARAVAEKIRVSLAAAYLLVPTGTDPTVKMVEHHCSVSIGVVVFSNHESSQDDILKWGDAAMYRAKEAGCNAVCFHDPQPI